MKRSTPNDRQLRAIGQRLRPVVTVAGAGLTSGVLDELDRALAQHELVKVRISVGDRDARRELVEALCERSGARRIQTIGNTALLLRQSDQPDPRLSNLLRPH